MNGPTTIVVIGALNTDIIAQEITHFPKPGQHVYGRKLVIGPGGKSRNMATMMAKLMPKNSVAMVGRTIQDEYGIWKPPVTALREAGVNTESVRILPSSESDKLPSVVLIPVDKQGNNMLFALPGISDDFSKQDIDDAEKLFDSTSHNRGLLVLSMECPLETARHAVRKANAKGIRAALDPGGITSDVKIDELIAEGLFLIKPNEHETKVITGIEVTGLETATKAATKLQKMGAKNVLITVGPKGAYLFASGERTHIPAPVVGSSGQKDATGCGDQTMAALCAFLQTDKSLKKAAEMAVAAGTLQFKRAGIQPLDKQEITTVISS